MSEHPRLEQIQTRLDAATPGPWFASRFASRYYIGAGEDQSDPDVEIAKTSFKPDAELIAAAPTDLAAMLGAVKAVLAIVDLPPDLTTTSPKGDKRFYIERHRVWAAINEALKGKQ